MNELIVGEKSTKPTERIIINQRWWWKSLYGTLRGSVCTILSLWLQANKKKKKKKRTHQQLKKPSFGCSLSSTSLYIYTLIHDKQKCIVIKTVILFMTIVYKFNFSLLLDKTWTDLRDAIIMVLLLLLLKYHRHTIKV